MWSWKCKGHKVHHWVISRFLIHSSRFDINDFITALKKGLSDWTVGMFIQYINSDGIQTDFNSYQFVIKASLNDVFVALNVQPGSQLLTQHWCLATERIKRAALHWYLLQAHLCKNWTGCSTHGIHQADIMGAIIISEMCRKRSACCCFKLDLKKDFQQVLTWNSRVIFNCFLNALSGSQEETHKY